MKMSRRTRKTCNVTCST